MKHVFYVLTIFMVGPTAHAEPINGNQIYSACQNQEPAQMGFCAGYVAAMIEGLSWGVAVSGLEQGLVNDAASANELSDEVLGYCIPDGAINEQMVDVVIKYLSDNPDRRHISARILINRALKQAFPC